MQNVEQADFRNGFRFALLAAMLVVTALVACKKKSKASAVCEALIKADIAESCSPQKRPMRGEAADSATDFAAKPPLKFRGTVWVAKPDQRDAAIDVHKRMSENLFTMISTPSSKPVVVLYMASKLGGNRSREGAEGFGLRRRRVNT